MLKIERQGLNVSELLYKKVDKKYNFMSCFSPYTGAYMRTGILEDGKDTGIDPFMASFPELLDIGIMGHCTHGESGLCAKTGVQCYQNGLHITEPNMTLENFTRIAKECSRKTFQFALGGRGDADQHEKFEEILKCCRKYKIIPNFTTSGLGMTEEKARICKKYCGAVAVSWYRQDYTYRAIQLLIDAKVKTNIHYVLGKNSIDEAIERLKSNDFPKGINAVVFLLHKPVGLGQEDNVLTLEDSRLQQFFSLIDNNKFSFKIGFDSCTVPGLINYTNSIDENSIDTCEAGRWSAYITSDMKMLPCSFDNQDMKWAYDISNDTVQNAWNSKKFNEFRSHFKNSCIKCKQRQLCLGGCPIKRQIILCNKPEKQLI